MGCDTTKFLMSQLEPEISLSVEPESGTSCTHCPCACALPAALSACMCVRCHSLCSKAVALSLLLLLAKHSWHICLFGESEACVGKDGPSRVGDGGASWRLKALARAKQQASDSSNPNFGRRVGDIVSEQWGSLDELTKGLTDTRAAHGTLLAAKSYRVLTSCCLISQLTSGFWFVRAVGIPD